MHILPHTTHEAQCLATKLGYLSVGSGVSAWAALVPYVKTRLGIDESVLGLLILCLGVGSVVSMPIAGLLTTTFGCRRVLVAATPVFTGALALLAFVGAPFSLALSLLLFGAMGGIIDVTLNIQGASLEKLEGRPLMPIFHGMYSAGGFVGAGSMTLLLKLGLSPLAATLCLCGAFLALLAGSGKHFLSDKNEAETSTFALPRGKVLLLGLLCFIAFLSEGVILDWGALFMTTLRDVPPSSAGVAYAVFSVAMTIGRFCGPRIIQGFGLWPTMIYGCLAAASGFAVIICAPYAWASLAGFAIVGLSLANLVPLLFTVTARQKDMPLHAAVASVATLGYTGIFLGPAVMGGIAHASSLAVVFAIVAVLMLCAAGLSKAADR